MSCRKMMHSHNLRINPLKKNTGLGAVLARHQWPTLLSLKPHLLNWFWTLNAGKCENMKHYLFSILSQLLKLMSFPFTLAAILLSEITCLHSTLLDLHAPSPCAFACSFGWLTLAHQCHQISFPSNSYSCI